MRYEQIDLLEQFLRLEEEEDVTYEIIRSAYEAASDWQSFPERYDLCASVFSKIAARSYYFIGPAYKQLGDLTFAKNDEGAHDEANLHYCNAAKFLLRQIENETYSADPLIQYTLGLLYQPEKQIHPITEATARRALLKASSLGERKADIRLLQLCLRSPSADDECLCLESLKNLMESGSNIDFDDYSAWPCRDALNNLVGSIAASPERWLDYLKDRCGYNDSINELFIRLAVKAGSVEEYLPFYEEALEECTTVCNDTDRLVRYALLAFTTNGRNFTYSVKRFGMKFLLGPLLIDYASEALPDENCELSNEDWREYHRNPVYRSIDCLDRYRVFPILFTDLLSCPFPQIAGKWAEFTAEVCSPIIIWDQNEYYEEYIGRASFDLLKSFIHSALNKTNLTGDTIHRLLTERGCETRLLKEAFFAAAYSSYEHISRSEKKRWSDLNPFVRYLKDSPWYSDAKDLIPETYWNKLWEVEKTLISVGEPQFCNDLARKLYYGEDGYSEDPVTALKLYQNARNTPFERSVERG